MSAFEHLSETAKHWGDVLSIGGLLAVFAGLLPALTALAVFAWTALRIYECVLSIRLKRRELDQ